MIVRIQTKTDKEAEAQLKNIFLHPVNAKECSMIRIHSVDGPLKHYLVIQVHHLVVDGEGVKRICVKFAEIYQALYRDKDWKPAKVLDPCRSWQQMVKNVSLRSFLFAGKVYFSNMFAMIASVLKKGTRYQLIGDRDVDKDLQEASYFESIIIEEELMMQFKAFTSRQQITVNDVFMTSFSLATMQWNTDRGDERAWLRFYYTANLRRWWGEPNGTFGNFSIVLTHEEVFENLQSPSLALANTKAKVDKVKKLIGINSFILMMLLQGTPYVLIRQFFLGIKGKLIEFLRHNHVMTNIGIIYKEAGDFGHTQAVNYSLLAPTVADGCILFTLSTYRNVTTIHLGSTESSLKKESAKRFLTLWKQMILKVISEQ
ncbi:MAG: hypothetical protein D3923_15350 [Candidatus Electrothrix sp. AR3]|nr:hypothetical protein [Candidatus Electrothrix sp. AR3]